MNLLPSRKHGVFGQGQSVINAVTVAAGFGMLLLGYDQGLMAGLIGGANTPFSRTYKNPTETALGIMVAIYEIGCFFGAVFIFLWGEKLGRRVCMLAGGAVMLIGATLQAASTDMRQLIAGRIVTGLGNGAIFSTIPVWASEISGFEERGKVAAFNGWLIVWGLIMVVRTTKMLFSFAFPLMVFGITMMLMVSILPESPRWLVSQNRDQEAKEVLRWITPTKNQSSNEQEVMVNELYESIAQARELEVAMNGDFSYKELFSGGTMQNFRRVAICFGIMALQQLSGINVLTYYISYVLENSVGLNHHLSLLIGGFNGLEYLLASIIPIWTIERFGRRKLLLISATGQAASMAILSAAIWYVTENSSGSGAFASGIVAVVCFFTFNTFYAQGFLAIPFFYPAEIASLRTRSRAVSISVMSNWLFTFLVVMITPICTANIGWRTYVIFAVLNTVFIPIIYFLFPETAGLTLEALNSLFDIDGVTGGIRNKEHRRLLLDISRRQAHQGDDFEELHGKSMSVSHVET